MTLYGRKGKNQSPDIRDGAELVQVGGGGRREVEREGDGIDSSITFEIGEAQWTVGRVAGNRVSGGPLLRMPYDGSLVDFNVG